jgi:hypothetical protein
MAITVTDESLMANLTAVELRPDGRIQIDEGGVIRWGFIRNDASEAIEIVISPAGSARETELTHYDLAVGLTVRMEPGIFLTTAVLHVRDNREIADWDQQTSWKITDASGRSDVFQTPEGGSIPDAYVYKVADDDQPWIGLVRFYNKDTGGHFFTASEAERSHILATMPSMVQEGLGFRGLWENAPGATEVFRFYDTNTATHFFTSSVEERNAVLANLPSFSYEGVGFLASNEDGVGLTEVYRFFNARTGDHHYTASITERNTILENLPDYVPEGVSFYVPEDISGRLIG